MLTKSIYVSEVNNLSDARYCSGMGVDLIGVSIDESNPNFLPLAKFKEISGWVVGVNWILESENLSSDWLLQKSKEYEVSRVRVSDSNLVKQLIDKELEVVLKVDEIPDSTIDSSQFLGYDLGFTEKLLDTLENYAQSKIYLSGDITLENLELINEHKLTHGVILVGGDELRPGFKDMDALIDAIEVFEE